MVVVCDVKEVQAVGKEFGMNLEVKEEGWFNTGGSR
jgi:hypothetical protein